MRIAVYCSAKDTIPEEYLRLGDELGKWIAQSGHTLVYGGATGGLMTRTSNAARQAGGEVTGVVPQRIISAGRLAQNCTTLHIVSSMAERKQTMREIADCFVCLPGSYGTLDEMYDVIASGTVGEHKKPIYILNYKGFYNGIRREAEDMRALRFLPQQEAYAPKYVNTLAELYEALTNDNN
ncbi:MAG: TIGR00730 family Rossman fold protein [Paludibacteraceae bacterium]|jgi:TIGR00730 family protein|nr:TIGR00730 family Rossman fold protein [Paludibacteraceae bacterium]